jgi:outer membrane protein assembly factor BamA
MKSLSFLFLCAIFGFGFAQAQVPDSLLRPDSTKDFIDQFIEQKITITKVLLVGNKKTKPRIITRELIFHEGDTLTRYVLQEAMQRSRENLLNTSLFNFVEIYEQPDSNDPLKTFIIIKVTERWYLWPLPIFELVDRNFNEWWLTKDFSRINYGAFITEENFLGLKQTLQLLIRLGYSQKLALYYSIPYINKKQQDGLTFNISFTRNHEIAYADYENKLLFYKDENIYVRKQFSTGLRLTHRSGIHDYHSYTAEYQDNVVSDTIPNLNENYFLEHENTEKLIFLSYQFRRDYRDIKIYPLKGYYYDFEIVKQGLGIMENEPSLLSMNASLRKYFEINSRWHFAAGVKGKLSGQSFAPYYNSRGLGYGNDFVRGYEYYVVNGQNYTLFKANIKFTLVPEHVIKIKYIPLEKFNTIPFAFYLNVFSDMAYVRDRQFGENNSLTNSYLFGTGVGIDYVTYYDLILRVEYSINKMGEHGLFLHFTSPIW